jgi:ESS family glutamate:Na+ symporter
MTDWGILIDLGVISIALLLATVLRARIGLLQRFLIPNAIVAGLILLFFYNLLAPLLGMGVGADAVGGLGDAQAGPKALVFHLLNLTMIAMGLRAPNQQRDSVTRPVLKTATVIITQISLQGIVSFGLTFVFIALPFLPSLFPSYGYLVALGYALGPGQAFSIGSGWEASGFVGAGGLGLIFGAVGFIIACVIGVIMINYGVRHGLTATSAAELREHSRHSGLLAKNASRPSGMALTTRSDAIDSLTLNLAAVFGVYAATYLLVLGITTLLTTYAGDAGGRLASNIWGIAFIFGLLLALLTRRLLGAFGKAHYLDPGAMTRISGGSVDFMVAAAFGAISFAVVSANWLPVVVFSVVVAIVAFISIIWMTSRLFPGDFAFERAVLHWGTLTGTLSTGLALLRVLDPELKTPAAPNYVYASGISFFALIPYLLNMNRPVDAELCQCRQPLYVALVVMVAYLLVVAAAFLWLRPRDKDRGRSGKRLWAR